jgi:diacylglycerol kinase (ATP)
MRKLLFFINPIAGTGSQLRLEKKILKKCGASNIHFDILPTAADGNYSFLPDKVGRDHVTDVIICCGDGTINPIVASLLGIKVNVGIVPRGSGNGLAFTAKIPKSPDKALDVIFKGTTGDADAFLINGKLSCMLSGIGLDAKVAYDFAMQKKRGLSTYITQTIKNFLAAAPYHFEINIHGNLFPVDAYFICIANSNQFGNNFTIAPQASLSDGLLDIIVVKKMRKTKILWSVFMQMKTGKTLVLETKNWEHKSILYFQAEALKIINTDFAPLHIDGDHCSTAEQFDIKVIPAAFRLIRP